MRRRSTLRVQELESRLAPATRVSPTAVVFQDVDGDDVTVTLSRPLLTPANVASVFRFAPAFATTGPQQLQTIDVSFNNFTSAAASGTGITVKAVRNASRGGNGFANVGAIYAVQTDLGAVSVRGDLVQIDAGDLDFTTPGLLSLSVQSMGRYGTSTEDGSGVNSHVSGKLGSLSVKSDFVGVRINVTADTSANARIGTVTVGGSLLGVGTDFESGAIFAEGDIGTVTIGGDVIGADGPDSGRIHSDQGTVGRVTIGGSLIGGAGENSGSISSARTLGQVRVAGDVRGGPGTLSGVIFGSADVGPVRIGGDLRGGDGENSGQVWSDVGKLAGVTVAGSLVGGAGVSSARIEGVGDLGPVKIGGDVRGGSARYSGQIGSGRGRIASVTVGGSFVGGDDESAGWIAANTSLGPVKIGHDVQGGAGRTSAQILCYGGRVAGVTVGGSVRSGTGLRSGSIIAQADLGPVVVGGSLIGTVTHPVVVSAQGKANLPATATADLAITRLAVRGRVEFAVVLAGYDKDLEPTNADAQIGPVTVGGDWIASSLVAGVVVGQDDQFGTGDDARIVGPTDRRGVVSKVASLTIGGQAFGSVGTGDQFGIVAEQLGAIKVGGVALPLTGAKDAVPVGATGDLTALEV
jgi:hypothetical protein